MMAQQQAYVRQRFSQVMTTCSILSAIMVVWIHTYNVEVYGDTNRVIYWLQDVMSQGLARGAVPFFLMSSAYFLYSKDKKVLEVYRSRSVSVALPYLLWNGVYMVTFAILRHLSLTNAGMDTITVGNVVQGLFLHKYNYAYWFMRDLIVLVALYPLIRWILGRGKVVAWIGLAVLVTVFYWKADFLGSGVYYYIGAVIGYHYRDCAEKVVVMKRGQQMLLLLASACVCGVLYWMKNVCKIEAVELFRDLAMAFLLFFTVSLGNLRIGGWFAGLSFMIYSIHPLLLEMVEKIIYRAFPHTDLFMLLDYLVAPIVCIALIVAVCWLWKKVLPTTYKWFNGGRI